MNNMIAMAAIACATLLLSCGGGSNDTMTVDSADTTEHAHPELPNVAWRLKDSQSETVLRFKKLHNTLLYGALKSHRCADGGMATAMAKVVASNEGYVGGPNKAALKSTKNCPISFDTAEASYAIADSVLTITHSNTKATEVYNRAPELDLKFSCVDIKEFSDQGQRTCLEVYGDTDSEVACMAAGGRVVPRSCQVEVSKDFVHTCPRHTVTEGKIASSMLYFYRKKPAAGCP